MISTRRWVIDTPVVETTGVLRTGLVWIRMHPSNSSGFPFWAGYPRLSVGSCFSVMKAILAHPSPLQIDTPYSLDPASEYRVCGLKFSSRSWRLPPTHFNTGLSDASMLAMRFFPMRLSHECEEYNHRIIMPKQEQASERPHRLRNGCVHAIIADMMIFDDLYYSFDMLQRRLHNLSGQDGTEHPDLSLMPRGMPCASHEAIAQNTPPPASCGHPSRACRHCQPPPAARIHGGWKPCIRVVGRMLLALFAFACIFACIWSHRPCRVYASHRSAALFFLPCGEEPAVSCSSAFHTGVNDDGGGIAWFPS